MTKGKIGVGIIGGTADRGWAMSAHIPALQSLDGYELRAVSTSRPESARAAADAFGVPACTDPAELSGRDDVDLVVVSVKVPTHLALVTAAIEAGKDVYCEWPLGNGLAESEHLAALARQRGVRSHVGLQVRSAPPIRYVRDLIAEGFVGEVLSTSMIASGGEWGDVVTQPNAYIHDRATGATMLTIPFGHTVDALCWVLGEFRDLMATTAVRRPDVTVVDTGAHIVKTTEDQIAVTGTLESGAVASIHYRGGMSRGTNFLWEINGTKGDIRLTADFGHLQIVPATLYGAQGDAPLAEMSIPAHYIAAPQAPAGAPYNVAQAYARLASNVAVPDFDDAVLRHRMIAAIEESAATGRRTSYR